MEKLDLVIVSGASKGIGNSIAKKCSAICKNIFVVSSSDKIYDIELEDNSCKQFRLKLDLVDYNDVEFVINKTITSLSRFESINSVGIVLAGAQISSGSLFESELDDWDRLYRCNVLGNLAIVKGCQNFLKKDNFKSRIVFFGGGGAAFATDLENYGSTKCATIRIAENLSESLKKYNIDNSTISLAPGFIETDIGKFVRNAGSKINTVTDISEPTNFVYNFLTDTIDSKKINGRFIHVRDQLNDINFDNQNICKLRRIE